MIEKATNSRVFLIILAVQLCAIFVKQWHYDDGWVLVTIEQLKALNRFSYFYILDDPEYTFVKPFFYLLSLLPADGFSSKAVFLFLLPSALCSAVMLYVVHKINTRFLLDKLTMSGVLIPLLLLNYFSIYGPSGISMRPDIFIMLACAYAIWAHLRLRVDGRLTALLGSIFASGLALSFHPIGVLAGFINLFSFFQNFRRLERGQVLSILLVGAVSIGLAIMLLLWGKTIGEFWVDFEKISNDRGHFTPFYHEYLRYLRLISNYGLYGVLIGLLVLVGLFYWLAGFVTKKIIGQVQGQGWVQNLKDVQSIFLLSFLFLFIFPIKWSHYVGLVILPLALLTPIILTQLLDKIYLRFLLPYGQKILAAYQTRRAAARPGFFKRVFTTPARGFYWGIGQLCRIGDVKTGLHVTMVVLLIYTGFNLVAQFWSNYYLHNLVGAKTTTAINWGTLQSFHLGQRVYAHPYLMPHYSLSNLSKRDRPAAPIAEIIEDYAFLTGYGGRKSRDECPFGYVKTIELVFAGRHLKHCEIHVAFPRYFYNYRFFE